MNLHNGLKQRITTLVLTLMTGISMNAAAGVFGFGGDRWKEEVLLHDGSKIIVERTAKRHGRHEIGQRPPVGDQSISFTMPGTNRQVVWKDEFSEDVSGANFHLMALDVVQDDAYLVVTPMGCLSYNKWGRPNPPYVIYKYQGHVWTRIPLQELPAEIKLPNMLHSSPDDVAEKRAKDGVVSAQVIREEIERYRQPEFKSILREPVKGGITSCEQMIPYGKGGWLGFDWFKDQPSYDACSNFCEKKGVSQQNCPCQTLFKGAK